jgi:hypothetical protein
LIYTAVLAGASVWASAPAEAQTTPAPATVASTHLAGVVVEVELAEGVSSKTHKRGDTFAIRLVSPVTVDGRTIPAGTTGVGQVVDAASSGPLGRPAKLLLAARYLEVDGRQVPLHAFHLGGAGKDQSNAILAASVIPVAGLLAGFIHGGEIEIPAGTHGQAKLAAPASQMTAAAAAGDATPSHIQEGD